VIAPANAGGEAINSIKQATEFGVVPGSQKFVSLPTFINDVDGWGLRQGTRLAGAFLRRPGRQNPGLVVALFEIDQQATKYGGGRCRSSTTHDLQAIAAAETSEKRHPLYQGFLRARWTHSAQWVDDTRYCISARSSRLSVQGAPPWAAWAILGDWASRGDGPPTLRRSNRATWQAPLMPARHNADPDQLRGGDRCDDSGRLRLVRLAIR